VEVRVPIRDPDLHQDEGDAGHADIVREALDGATTMG